MYICPLKRLSHKKRLILFLRSYNGLVLLLGISCLIFSFLYTCLFIDIEAPFQFMVPLGKIFYAISLSIIASTIFYFITVYFPKWNRRKVEEYYIRKWLQQLEQYGKCILEDIAKKENCTYKEFITAASSICLNSQPPSYISSRELVKINTWYEYFENLFHWESVYMKEVEKYRDSVPAKILVKFEELRQFDNLRGAIYNHKKFIDAQANSTLASLGDLIYQRARTLIDLSDLYIEHMYD